MKIEFLEKNPENTRLILVAAGWSAGTETAAGISMPGWDVALIHDYTTLDADLSFLNNYYTVYLFAWSLGVLVSELVLPAERITAAFAINGTLMPVHDVYGIPCDIYNGTLNGLDSRNLKKFRLRMAGNRELYEHLWGNLEEDSDRIENLREQLRLLQSLSTSDRKGTLPWVRAYLSQNDRIFPYENMQRAWLNEPETETIAVDGDHYVNIENIVKSVISDPSKVSQRFSKASVTYDTHAIAQYAAALKLTSMLMDANPRLEGKVLEIGCGTGLFTREYSRKLKPRSATFVDITKTGPFGIAQEEEYHIEDAERWIETCTDKWDAILSASAIQWFADIPRFLHRCHECLEDDGIIAISTFAPGNMEELTALRPSPIIYPKRETLEKWLQAEFRNVKVIEDEIKVEFQSVRDMLMHLKHTGVGGSAPKSSLSISDMAHLRSLTYRPIYITARK